MPTCVIQRAQWAVANAWETISKCRLSALDRGCHQSASEPARRLSRPNSPLRRTPGQPRVVSINRRGGISDPTDDWPCAWCCYWNCGADDVTGSWSPTPWLRLAQHSSLVSYLISSLCRYHSYLYTASSTCTITVSSERITNRSVFPGTSRICVVFSEDILLLSVAEMYQGTVVKILTIWAKTCADVERFPGDGVIQTCSSHNWDAWSAESLR